jgi:exosortase/archaeosortase family protein
VLYFAWDFFYWRFIFDNAFTWWLRDTQTFLSCKVLQFFGFSAYALSKYLYIDGIKCVAIANQCNGLDFFGVFICTLIAYPSSIKAKLTYIPIGIILVFGLNILRISLLAVNHHYFKGSFEFNHKFTYTYTIYILVFISWFFWLKWIDKSSEKEQQTHSI